MEASGADPVSAIANGVGSLFNAIGGIVQGRQNQKIIRQQRLLEEGPEYQDYLSSYKEELGNRNLIIIAILAAIIVAVIISSNGSKSE